jgi:hypothetical protein
MIIDPSSWPGASNQVIEAINRILAAANKRSGPLSLTNTENYFTAHLGGEAPRNRTDWCFWPKGEFFLTEIRQPRSSAWDGRFDKTQAIKLLEYNTNNGGRYRLKVFPSCGPDAISGHRFRR